MSSTGPHVKNFIWKLVHGILLVAVALRAKGLIVMIFVRFVVFMKKS